MAETTFEWTKYFLHRLRLRKFSRNRIEEILRYSSERYEDTVTGRFIVVGRHQQQIVLVVYEIEGGTWRPITVHATSRQQVRYRVRIGRLISV